MTDRPVMHVAPVAARRPLRVGVQLPEVEREVRWPEYVAMARRADMDDPGGGCWQFVAGGAHRYVNNKEPQIFLQIKRGRGLRSAVLKVTY